MGTKTNLAAISIAAVVAIAGFAVSNPTTPAYACWTAAQGCIEQGGPGQSFLARPEVAGCHFFPPTPDCATLSTPPGMGAGP